MKSYPTKFSLCIGVLFFGAWAAFCDGNSVPMNKIQVIASHNSYKLAIEEPLWEHLYKRNPRKAKSLQYEHPSLNEQLTLGLRGLELDVFYDPKGGYFVDPKGLEIVRQYGGKVLAFDEHNELSEPGLKMFHIQDIDFRSHHLLFRKGLIEIKEWSDANSGHLPIIVLINAKDQRVKDTRVPLPFDEKALSSIDSEIMAVLGEEKLITPDLVRGSHERLDSAIRSNGWPSLNEAKGKFLFVLDEKLEKNERYLNGHPSLKG